MASASPETAGAGAGRIICAIEARTCYRHHDRETGRSCTRCGRPACPECLTQADVGSRCPECAGETAPGAGRRARARPDPESPLVTKVIVGVNLGVFVLGAFGGMSTLGGGAGELQRRLALNGAAVAAGDWYRLVTAGFVHFGLLHIAFNMVILYRFGTMLEPPLGRARFFALYFAALLAGSFGAMLLRPEGLTAGASGAVFGVVGAAAMGLRQRGVNVWQTDVGGLLLINLLLTFLVPGISIGGHVGGLVGGAAVGSVMLRSPTERRSLIQGLAVASVVAGVSVVGTAWAVAA